MFRLIESIIEFFSRILSLLFGSKPDVEETSKEDLDKAVKPTFSTPAWYRLAQSEIGTKEIPGEEDNPAIVAYFADAGFSGIKDDETAWCMAAVNSWVERSGKSGTKSLAARSALKWGKKLKKPKKGCVTVLWRDSPNSWKGHVGLYVKEDKKYVYLLGGNQRNEVNVSRYPKSRVLGHRWPVTLGNSRTYRAGALGMASLSGGLVLETFVSMGNEVKGLGEFNEYLPLAGSILICIGLIAKMAMVWARADDLKEKGR